MPMADNGLETKKLEIHKLQPPKEALELVSANPDIQTKLDRRATEKGLGLEEVEVEGADYRVHETDNLLQRFQALELPQGDQFGDIMKLWLESVHFGEASRLFRLRHLQLAKWVRYYAKKDAAFSVARNAYPSTSKEYEQLSLAHGVELIPEMPHRRVVMSMTYEALVPIVAEIAKKYDKNPQEILDALV